MSDELRRTVHRAIDAYAEAEAEEARLTERALWEKEALTVDLASEADGWVVRACGEDYETRASVPLLKLIEDELLAHGDPFMCDVMLEELRKAVNLVEELRTSLTAFVSGENLNRT